MIKDGDVQSVLCEVLGDGCNLCQFVVCILTLSLHLTVLWTAQVKSKRQLLHLRASR